MTTLQMVSSPLAVASQTTTPIPASPPMTVSTATSTTTSTPSNSGMSGGGWAGIGFAIAAAIAITLWLAWVYEKRNKSGSSGNGAHEDLPMSSSTLRLVAECLEQDGSLESRECVDGEKQFALHALPQAQLIPPLLSPGPQPRDRPTSIGFKVSVLPAEEPGMVSSVSHISAVLQLTLK
jgi:hypothetical protein